MKTKTLLILALLLLAACTPLTTKQTPTNHKVGIQSLGISFNDQQQLFEGETTTLLLTLENKGAADILNGLYTIIVDHNLLELQEEQTQQFNLPGKSELNPIGEKDIISIDIKAKTLPPQTETRTTKVSITACYPYQTLLTANVCIDTDLLGKDSNKPCTMKATTYSSQGAPITITKIEPKITKHDKQERVIPEFTITMKNKGKGKLFAPEKIVEACTSKSLGDNWHVATITAYLGETQLHCIPTLEGLEGKANLEKENIVKCKLADGVQTIQGTYVSPLVVEVNYGYTFTVNTQLQLQTLQ